MPMNEMMMPVSFFSLNLAMQPYTLWSYFNMCKSLVEDICKHICPYNMAKLFIGWSLYFHPNPSLSFLSCTNAQYTSLLFIHWGSLQFTVKKKEKRNTSSMCYYFMEANQSFQNCFSSLMEWYAALLHIREFFPDLLCCSFFYCCSSLSKTIESHWKIWSMDWLQLI